MKKSEVKKKLVKLLKTWENSKLDSKFAEEILELLTGDEVRMKPPQVTIPGEWMSLGENCVWEPETKGSIK